MATQTVSAIEGPSAIDDPRAVERRAKLLELQTERAKIIAQLERSPQQELKDATRRMSAAEIQADTVKCKSILANREALHLTLEACEAAIKTVSFEATEALDAASRAIWKTHVGAHRPYIEKIIQAADGLMAALAEEEQFIGAVRRRAYGGAPVTILTASAGIANALRVTKATCEVRLHDLDKAIAAKKSA